MNFQNHKAIINPFIEELFNFRPKLKLGILASGKGTNFKAIILDIISGRLDAEIKCLIVNNPNCGAIQIAKEYSIPFKVINHRDYSSRNELDKEIISTFKYYNVEGIVMAGWMRIVTQTLLNEYPDKVINIHPSLLPSFKGSNAIEKALASDVKITGCSVHLVKEEVDSGEILVQAAVSINKKDDEISLLSKVQQQEHKIISIGIAIAACKWRNLD